MIQPYGSDRCYYGLAPGAEVSATYWWTPTVAGQYSLIGVADARDDVRESSESNNTLNAFVNVLSPDTTPPPAPPLQSPPDGETLSPGSVRLAWQPVADPGSNGVRYDVQVSRLSGFGLLADSASNLDGQWFNTRELSAGTYYWRVRSKDYRNNTSAWSPAWSFRIAASSLSGWITAAGGGGGIMNATVTVTSYSGQAYSATTDSDGRYNIAALPASFYRLRVERAGFHTLQEDQWFTVLGPATRSASLVSQIVLVNAWVTTGLNAPGTSSVAVSTLGVESSLLFYYSIRNDGPTPIEVWLGASLRSAAGAVRSDPGNDRSELIPANGQLFVSRPFVVATDAQPGLHDALFGLWGDRLPNGAFTTQFAFSALGNAVNLLSPSLHGRITLNGTTQGLAGARVVLRNRLDASDPRTYSRFHAYTDSQGRYALTNVPDGPYSLEVTAMEYEPRDVPVSVGAEASVDVTLVPRSLEYGMTVITHGRDTASRDDWTDEMACRIVRAARKGRAFVYRIDEPQPESFSLTELEPSRCVELGAWSASEVGRYTPEPGSNQFETVVVFDWAEASDDPVRLVAEDAGDILFAFLRTWQPGRLRRLHFIGHSRGTIVNSEAIERLLVTKAREGLQVDDIHMTGLDPHDWGFASRFVFPADTDVNQQHPEDERQGYWTWRGLSYADSYFQDSGPGIRDIGGERIPGSCSWNLEAFHDGHRGPVDFYMRTIDDPFGYRYDTAPPSTSTVWSIGGQIHDNGYRFGRLLGGVRERTEPSFQPQPGCGRSQEEPVWGTAESAIAPFDVLMNGSFRVAQEADSWLVARYAGWAWPVEIRSNSARLGVLDVDVTSTLPDGGPVIEYGPSRLIHHPFYLPQSASQVRFRFGTDFYGQGRDHLRVRLWRKDRPDLVREELFPLQPNLPLSTTGTVWIPTDAQLRGHLVVFELEVMPFAEHPDAMLSIDDVEVLLSSGSEPSAFAKLPPSQAGPSSARLSWTASTGALSYEYCADTTNDGMCDGSWTRSSSGLTATVEGLAPLTQYFWQVRATNLAGATDADAATWGTFSITSTAGSGTLQFGSTTYTFGEAAGVAQVVVTRANGSAGVVSATIAPSGGTAGTSDFSGLPETVTFGDGDTTPKIVSIAITQDVSPEPDETIELGISVSAGASVGTPAAAILTIQDDDSTTTPYTLLYAQGSELRRMSLDGVVVESIPLGRPIGYFDVADDVSRIVYTDNVNQIWVHDRTSGQSELMLSAPWVQTLKWLPGSNSVFVHGASDGNLYSFNVTSRTSALWQSADTAGVYGKNVYRGGVAFSGVSAGKVVARIGVGGAGGDGVFVGDYCTSDPTHHICSLQVVSNPAGAGSGWDTLAGGPSITQDGRYAFYTERIAFNTHRVMRRDLSSGTVTAIYEATTSGLDTGFGSTFLFDDDQYLAFPDLYLNGDRTIRVCDLGSSGGGACAPVVLDPPGAFGGSQVLAVRWP